MKGEFATLDVGVKALRLFGFLVGGIIVAIALFLSLFLHKDIHVVMPLIGVALLAGALLYPRILLWPYYAWMGIAIVLGYFVGNILLVVLFYLFVTPIALLRSFFRTDDAQAKDSYWITRKESWTKESMEQLF
jgi:hypothetical protein